MYRTIFLFSCLLGAGPARAQETYLAEALEANPRVSAAYADYGAARQKAPQKGALEEPKLSYSEFLSPVETRTGPQQRALTISQELPWPGVLKLRERVADAEARRAYYRYEVERREVLEQVGLATIEYAYLKRATERASENLDLLRQLEPVVDEKIRGGGSLSTRLRLEVETSVAEQELATLREQRPGLDAQLKSHIGRDPGAEPLPWPELPERPPALMTPDRIRSAIREHHPEVRLAEATVTGARRGEALAEKSNRPDFTVGANAIDIGDGGDTAGSVTVGVTLPIHREKYRAERREAAARTRAAGARLEDVERSLVAEGIRLYAEQVEAIDRLRNYDDDLIPSSEQAVELTKEDFRNDEATLTDLIEAERTLLDLRLMRVRALADAHAAAWRIRALTEPLSTDSK